MSRDSENVKGSSALGAGSGGAIPVFPGGGEMGALIRDKDWAGTPLGAYEAWPQSLKTVVRMLATSRYHMWMGWGKDLTFFYNDAYRPTLGLKHAWALGAPTREVWKEIWADVGSRIDHVFRSGEATWDEGLLLLLERSGYPEETYHTFSYSPLADDHGDIAGILCVVMEETDRIIGERRLLALRDLASGIGGRTEQVEVIAATERALALHPKDLPFTLIYLFDRDEMAHLVGTTGVAMSDPIAPTVIDPAGSAAAWPAAAILAGAKFLTVADIRQRFDLVPTGAWDEPPREAVVAMIARQGQNGPAGFLVVGLNPYRCLDESYRGFVDLVAGQIGSGFANAESYEEERKRAAALAEIDRAKTAFFANVSHELRTPLTLMLGPLEEMLARAIDEPLSAHLQLVQLAHRNGVRLLKLVNTLLEFSRIEAGRAEPNFEPVDLAALTADLASNFRSAIERAGLRLSVVAAPFAAPVYVDRDMWEKVVLNLLSNAFKFTLDGEIVVDIRPSSDGRHADVTVTDTGIGIPAEDLERLFERFHRVEHAQGRSIEGSGIGLALVQELVKLHKGSIRVQSRVGEGTAFIVSLPLGTAHVPQDRIDRAPPAHPPGMRAQAYVQEALGWLDDGAVDGAIAADAPLPPLSASVLADLVPSVATGQRVLLADDNMDMRGYLRTLLETAGYRVEAVSDGELALAAARRQRPDLILSDVMMPKLDGFGLLAALRADRDLHDVPFLLLSARAGEEVKVEGLSAGADDYLTKPFSARELLARVRVNLDMAALRREATRIESDLRRQAEAAHERSEAILASISDGFFAFDREWRFTYVNHAAERLNQRPRKTLIGQNCWEKFPAAANTAIEINLRRAMELREHVAFEYFYKPWNMWLDIRAYPARDGGLAVYFCDVTARRNAENAIRRVNQSLEEEVMKRTAELQHKEARLRSIFETSLSFQGLLSLDGILLDANRTSLSAIGATLDEVVGLAFWECPWFSATPGMSETIRTAISRVAAGEVMQQEIVLNLVVGGERSFEFTLRPMRDELGTQTAIICEAVEVTARRLAEQLFRQAQKMEGIGQLTGGVAHDFNNLLTIIVGNLETLKRQLTTGVADPASLNRSLENAMRGVHRAVSLTQHLLAFSRQQPLDPKPVEVGRLVSGMTDLLRRTLGEQIAIETVLAGGLWRTSVDANQLEIAVLNLAINARDAMPDGGRLTIETANAVLDERYAASQSEVIPGQYVLVAVTDSGIGMSEATLAKAFEPFFTTKDIGHGTGLGLSQVYGFVKQSGGHVKIYSELGEGTTVKLYLPRLHADFVAGPAEPVAKPPPRHANKTILLVEDDDDVRAYTRGVLHELGYHLLEAQNGSVALEILDRDVEIDLLFTDVGLPGGMNGRQLAEAAWQRRPKLKILFTTGYPNNAIVHDGRLDRGVQLITKPFTYVALAEKVSDILAAATAPPRILVVEDELLIQMLIVAYLEELGFALEATSTAAEAKSRLTLLQGEVDAAIIDLGLPDSKGDELFREIRAIYPSLPILIASGYDRATMETRFAGQSGLGFLSKPYTIEQLRSQLAALGVIAAA